MQDVICCVWNTVAPAVLFCFFNNLILLQCLKILVFASLCYNQCYSRLRIYWVYSNFQFNEICNRSVWFSIQNLLTQRMLVTVYDVGPGPCYRYIKIVVKPRVVLTVCTPQPSRRQLFGVIRHGYYGPLCYILAI